MTTITEALVAVMADVRAVAKRDRNGHQGFDFRGVDAVVNAVAPALRKHGVVVYPSGVQQHQVEHAQTKNGAVNYIHRIRVDYTFAGPEGDTITTQVEAEAMDMQDKGTAKAMSVAFRTVLLQALCLPTDEPDPDSISHEETVWDPPAPQQAQQQAPQQAPAERPAPQNNPWETHLHGAIKAGPNAILAFGKWAASNGAPQDIIDRARQALNQTQENQS